MTVYYGIDNIDVRIDNGTFADVNTATAPTSCERCTGSITNAVVCNPHRVSLDFALQYFSRIKPVIDHQRIQVFSAAIKKGKDSLG